MLEEEEEIGTSDTMDLSHLRLTNIIKSLNITEKVNQVTGLIGKGTYLQEQAN